MRYMKRKEPGCEGKARHGRYPARDTLAFTLIELLVVIAIIAILAALLFSCSKRCKSEGAKDRLP
jgi:prepilin-type N-terminal cleavage/methylation domain-containing protein